MLRPARKAIVMASFAVISLASVGQAKAQRRTTDLYTKQEVQIPMRDGARLFTSIYIPKDTSTAYPLLICRTPYAVGPYGKDFRGVPGPNGAFVDEKFIFVFQDVRGRYMSEGEFVDVRPQQKKNSGKQDVDESTDTWDTIDWLVKNVPNNNGRAGLYGISYPGFYAAAGMVRSHPALKASSPQAPIADWFLGDDWHHHGAFFLFDAFNFYQSFGQERPKPTTSYPPGFAGYGNQSAYDFLLQLGALRNADEKYFKGRLKFWNELMEHDTYDPWWKARRLDDKLFGVNCAVLTVGGWYDAEDLNGPLAIHKSLQKLAPDQKTTLVMGPWSHGGWMGSSGKSLGDQEFGSTTSLTFQNDIYLPWFKSHLKGDGSIDMPKAVVFRTGVNQWERLPAWPPKELKKQSIYLNGNHTLTWEPAKVGDDVGRESYFSDPSKPVPYTETVTQNRGVTYVTEDQTFASKRPDVLTFTGDPLGKAVTLAGPIDVDLWVSTTGTDADFVVKVIDVTPSENGKPSRQLLIRGDVMRAKFRRSYEKPEPFTPGKIERVRFDLMDLFHTFQPGHKIMVQIQSSWFPLVDRNPQTFTSIGKASDSEFQKATINVYWSKAHPSRLEVGVWETDK
jgi:putative CocE/NonD family hydrolase